MGFASFTKKLRHPKTNHAKKVAKRAKTWEAVMTRGQAVSE